jgi:hypothetical protein
MRKVAIFLLILAFSILLISCKESTSTSPTTTTTATTTTTTTTATTSTTTVETKPVVIRETAEGFDTIGEAIDAAEDGNHIDVAAGTYIENLVIEKLLYLTGEDRNITIIDGSYSGDVVKFEADAAGSDIRGFTVKNSDTPKSGIHCNNSALTIGRNVVKDNYYGIYYYHSSGEISGVLVEGSDGNGINTTDGTPTISEATFRSCYYAIACYGSISPTISACDIRGNSYGIQNYSIAPPGPDAGGGAGGSVGDNVIKGNTNWDYYNLSTEDAKAENNYWDHNTAAEIDSLDIWDDDEQAVRGMVDFIPFKTSVSSISSLSMKPRLLSASSLFADFFRSLFRSDLPASAMYLSSSFEPKLHIARFDLLEAGYRSLVDERYYPPLMLRASR